MTNSADMVERRQLFFRCPVCAKADAFQVTHFLRDAEDHRFGPWTCGNCRHAVAGEWVAADRAVRLTSVSPKPAETKGYVLLRLRGPGAEPLWFVVEHNLALRDDVADPLANMRYLYEEHHCPTNFVPVAGIIDGDGDEDAHGLFEYVEWAAEPPGWDRHGQDAWAQLFPRIGSGGMTIDGSASEGKATALPAPGR